MWNARSVLGARLWWSSPFITALRRHRQVHRCEFKLSIVYRDIPRTTKVIYYAEKLCFKKTNKKNLCNDKSHLFPAKAHRGENLQQMVIFDVIVVFFEQSFYV